MNYIWHQLSMRNTITTQLVSHDLPGLAAMASQQPFEEAFRRRTITPGLEKDINDIAILIHSPPEVVLLAVDPHEDFVDVEGIAKASVFSF